MQFGDIFNDNDAPSGSFHDYWTCRLSKCLAARGNLYRGVDARTIATGIPEPETPQFVHLDLFAGNMLWHDDAVSAVLDFGSATMLGDGRLNALFAAVYIVCEPASSGDDHSGVVHEWLRLKKLDVYFRAAKLNEPLERWCRSVLIA